MNLSLFCGFNKLKCVWKISLEEELIKEENKHNFIGYKSV